MTLERLTEIRKRVRFKQCYDNETGVAPVLVTGCTMASLWTIFELAYDRLAQDWPQDYQI